MKTHIYFVPGLSANSNIFKYINLPEDTFELHFLEWLIPESIEESIADYAKRMCESITQKDSVLVGVSFGGIIAQEMAKIVNPKKIFIISSVKTSDELPLKMKFYKITKAYKLFPINSITNFENLMRYTFGKKAEKPIGRYKGYLSVRNPLYLKWAIYNLLHWPQKEVLPNIIHIHGDADGIFPIKYIEDCIVIKGAPHVMMVLKKAKTISAIISNNLKD